MLKDPSEDNKHKLSQRCSLKKEALSINKDLTQTGPKMKMKILSIISDLYHIANSIKPD